MSSQERSPALAVVVEPLDGATTTEGLLGPHGRLETPTLTLELVELRHWGMFVVTDPPPPNLLWIAGGLFTAALGAHLLERRRGSGPSGEAPP